jgi:hypothetical protein
VKARFLISLFFGFSFFAPQAHSEERPQFFYLDSDPIQIGASGSSSSTPATAEAASLFPFLLEVEGLLPPNLKQHFEKGVRIQFSPLGPSRQSGEIRGRALIRVKPHTVALSSSLLADILAGRENSRPALDPRGKLRQHKTVYREAMATLLHETFHLYDYLNLQTPQMKAQIENCRFVSADDQAQLQHCAFYRDIKTTVSSNPYYLERAGYFLNPQGPGVRSKESSFQFRSPDLYEFQSPEEHAAVNFEYFLLDPDYACRRPGLSDFFAQHFQFTRASCKRNDRYVDPDASEIDFQTKRIRNLFREIPLDRLYQVHYLLADSGSSLMSRFGHSMLRLVICAPGQVKGPECLTKGLPQHLVLSFRAFVNTPSISNWAGLTGKYPSRLFVLPFESVISEYTEVEYRTLKSYPLNLNDSEIQLLVQRALETHWSYDSRYYFTSNNCAVETLNLIKSALLRPELMTETSIYPKQVLRILLKAGVASSLPKGDRQAIEGGFLFESAQRLHLNSLSRIRGQEVEALELEEFFKWPVEKRRAFYRDRLSPSQGAVDEKLQMSVFQLENFILKKKQTEFQDKIIRGIWTRRAGEALAAFQNLDVNELYKLSVEAFGALSAPYQILKSSDYGIPTESELAESEANLAEIKAQIERMREVKRETERQLQQDPTLLEIQSVRKLISDILSL